MKCFCSGKSKNFGEDIRLISRLIARTANYLICSWKAITNNEDENEIKQEQPEEEGMSHLKTDLCQLILSEYYPLCM